MNWTFLSKNGTDEYMGYFAQGCGSQPTPLETWNYEDGTNPLVLRGILKHKIIKRCWEDGRRFLYMDTGYLGNSVNPQNPHGWKLYHRVVPDNFQHDKIIPRPPDRLMNLQIQWRPRQTQGRKILIAAPDEKPCQVYGFELQQWLQDVRQTLEQHTDRPIEIRKRDRDRKKRVVAQPFADSLKDVWAVVTFNSNAATEAVLAGVPVFVLAPVCASLPVANTDLSRIENPWFPDPDLIDEWCRHLAYGQFHVTELKNGRARAILEAEWPR